jgi:hypothetical protein
VFEKEYSDYLKFERNAGKICYFIKALTYSFQALKHEFLTFQLDINFNKKISAFECSVCSRRYDSERQLFYHQRVFCLKRYCTLCDERFSGIATLNEHLKVHKANNNIISEAETREKSGSESDQLLEKSEGKNYKKIENIEI